MQVIPTAVDESLEDKWYEPGSGGEAGEPYLARLGAAVRHDKAREIAYRQEELIPCIGCIWVCIIKVCRVPINYWLHLPAFTRKHIVQCLKHIINYKIFKVKY